MTKAPQPLATTSENPWIHRARRLWWIPLVVVAVEVIGHYTVVARVPSADDFESAAAVVRANFEEGDAIVIAPEWADPLLREELGDLIPPEEAARSDLAHNERLWSFSIRGHVSEWAPPDVAPEFTARFGRVTVLRWNLGESPVVYDLTRNIRDAKVVIREGDADERSCEWRRGAPRSGGGLSQGPHTPAERFHCDDRRSWLWVADTINEDLDLKPRYCIWQHPPNADGYIRTTYEDVPLGERIVVHTGLYYEHERPKERPPYILRVLIDGAEAGRMRHEEGEGWARMEFSTQLHGSRRERGSVSIEVFAEVDPDLKTVCWAASTRGPRRAVGE